MRERLNGFVVGLMGIIAWAVLIFKDIFIAGDKVAYVQVILRSLSVLSYVMLLSLVMFTVFALMGRKISIIASALAATLIGVYFYYEGLRGIDGIMFIAFPGVLLLYSFFSGSKKAS